MVYDSDIGLDHWWAMRTNVDFKSPPIRDTRIWHTTRPVAQQYSDVAYDGLLIVGGEGGIGLFNDAHALGFDIHGTVFRSVDMRDVQGYAWTRTGQLWQAPKVEIRDSKLESRDGIRSDTGGQRVISSLGEHSYLTVANARFAHVSGGPVRSFTFTIPTFDNIPTHQVHIAVTDYQGQSGKAFTIDLKDQPFSSCSAPADVQPDLGGYLCGVVAPPVLPTPFGVQILP
jgi:hypothetical protein